MKRPEHNPVARLAAMGEKPGLRACINAMCAHCMGCTADHLEPGFRAQIRACTAPACPLHPVRPYQAKGGAK